MPSMAACTKVTVSRTGDAVGAGSAVADRKHLRAVDGFGPGQVELDHARRARGPTG